MRKTIKILRQRKGEKESFWQTFLYESEQENVTAAQALSELNQIIDKINSNQLVGRAVVVP